MKKQKKTDDLDTETTFSNMNVEGMPWYRPNKKDREDLPELSDEEKKAMVKGALWAYAPMFVGLLVVLGLIVGLAYLWLS